MKYTCWFHEISVTDVERVGGKGANLGEMTRQHFPVPPGFCLMANAYREFLAVTGLNNTIQAMSARINIDHADEVEDQTGRIRDLIIGQEMPAFLTSEILTRYHQLSEKMGLKNQATFAVAVRSSATAEDLPTASFAGQQDTYLNVRGEKALLEHIKSCWASLWTARAFVYRAKQGFDHSKVYLAVVVQAMIPSELSGILFTANPVDGRRDTAVINASWGLGEAIVSGLVTPDTILVDEEREKIIDRRIANKECAIRYAPDGGVVRQEIPLEQRQNPALTDRQALELVALGCRIERHYGAPQDIEWAYARGNWYILQVRPITTLPEPASSSDEYNRTMFVEIFPDPLTPVMASVIKTLFHSMLDFTFHVWGFQPPSNIEAVGIFYNQPYFNRHYIEAAFQPLSTQVRDLLVAQVVNPFGDQKGGAQIEVSLPYLRMVVKTLIFIRSFPNQLPLLLADYRAEVARVAGLPLQELSSKELVATIQELVFESTRELMDYDFLMIAVIKRVYHLLGIMLEPYFGEEAEVLRGKLISGVTGNVTMETNIHLWELAQLAKASDEVSSLIHQYYGEELIARLEQSSDGQAFLAELDTFLKQFGHREVRTDIIFPTWCEDPSPVFNFVRGYLHLGPEQDPRLQQAQLSKQRLDMTETVRARLGETMKGRFLIWPVFHWLLDSIEFHTQQRDTMHFEMTRIFPPCRRIFRELSKRWVEQGWLSQPDDIFFLSLDEMATLADDPKPVGNLTQARREELEANRRRSWPNVIRGAQEIYATDNAPVREGIERLDGVAGSPGVVTGKARVVRGPEEFHRLQKGDILVAPITNPVWTPLFAIASGVITEVGGILSHGAIVAREYGIPAVMSVTSVTRQVLDGQTVTIDGNQGCVYLKNESAA